MNKTALVLMDAEGVLMGILPNTKNQKELKKDISDAIGNAFNNEISKVKPIGKIVIGVTFDVENLDEDGNEESREFTLIETTIYGKL